MLQYCLIISEDVRNMLKFCFEMLFEEESAIDHVGDDDSDHSELTFDFDSLRKPSKGDVPDTSQTMT